MLTSLWGAQGEVLEDRGRVGAHIALERTRGSDGRQERVGGCTYHSRETKRRCWKVLQKASVRAALERAGNCVGAAVERTGECTSAAVERTGGCAVQL